MRPRVYAVAATMSILLAAGVLAVQLLADDDSAEPEIGAVATTTASTTVTSTTVASSSAPPTTSGTSTSTTAPAVTSTSEPPLPPVVLVLERSPPSPAEAMSIADVLAPTIRLPSDCGVPLDVSASLPNSSRDYRAGIHQGIDFICLERGRTASAALPGHVVMAVGGYVDPVPADRSAILGVAAEVGATPMWTLAMLYGNFVVLDHGVIDGVGHTVSIYAHLDSIDDSITAGVLVQGGQRLGEIGNHGTDSASTGADNPRSLHLHWELHIDNLYLGAGLDSIETREVYRTLFSALL